MHRIVKTLAPLALAITLASCGGEQDNSSEIASHFARSKAYETQGQYRAAIIEARNIIKKDRTNPAGFERLAEIQATLGSHRNVIKTIEAIDSPSKQSLFLLAQAYANTGKFNSASKTLATFEQAGGEKTTIDYQLLAARIQAGKGDTEKALEQMQLIADNFPGSALPLNALSETLLSLKQYPAAQKSINTTLEQHPKNAQALFLAAHLEYLNNNLEKAENLLTNSLLEQPETDIMNPLRSSTLRRLSRVLTEQGRSSEALIYSKILAEANPQSNDAQKQFSKALGLLQSGEVDQAELMLQDLHSSYPGNDISAIYLGLVNFQKGDYQEADKLLSKHIDTETATPKLIEATVRSKLQLRKIDEAIAILKQALQNHPENRNLQTMYAITALNSESERADGEILLEKLIAQQPNTKLRTTLARHYIKTGKQALAIAQLETLLKDQPSDIEATALYAATQLKNDQKKLAENSIVNLLDSQGSNKDDKVKALNLAATFYQQIQTPSKAKGYFQQALNIDPKNTLTISNLARLAVSEKNYSLAAKYFSQAIDADPSLPEGFKGLTSVYEMQNKEQLALAELNKLYTKYRSQTSTPAAVLAEYHLRKGNLDKAAQYLTDENIAVDNSNYTQSIVTSISYAKYKSEAAKSNWDNARKSLMEAISLTPNNERLISDLINLEIVSQRYPEAEQLISQASTDFPNSAMPVLAQSDLLKAQGQTKQAQTLLWDTWQTTQYPAIAFALTQELKPGSTKRVEVLEQWLIIQPNNTRALLLLATDKQAAGDATAATEYYRRIIKQSPNNLIALNNLAWLLFEAGDEQALSLSAQAYKIAPKNASVVDTYGWLNSQMGNKQLGIKLLKDAAALAPNDKAIAEHLNKASSASN